MPCIYIHLGKPPARPAPPSPPSLRSAGLCLRSRPPPVGGSHPSPPPALAPPSPPSLRSDGLSLRSRAPPRGLPKLVQVPSLKVAHGGEGVPRPRCAAECSTPSAPSRSLPPPTPLGWSMPSLRSACTRLAPVRPPGGSHIYIFPRKNLHS